MVRQTAVAGPISRATGVRLHQEMGDAGENIWAAIIGATRLGRSKLSWRGGRPPPVDVVDFERRLAYQVKVLTDPYHRVSFSGAHKHVKGGAGLDRSGRPRRIYVGTPEDKLEEIKKWLVSNELEGVLVIMLLDEDANRAVVYVLRDVANVRIKDMLPVGVVDNDTGTWVVPEWGKKSIEELGLPIPREVHNLPRFPDIPEFLRSSTKGEVVPELSGIEAMFRRVHVRQHKRRKW